MTIKNISKYYELYDNGCKADAETVVFLPGVACSTWMFRDAIVEFAPKYKVLIFNNPGTGDTPLPFNMTVATIAGIVREVILHLGLKKCTVVGHSMGGFTAQYLSQILPEEVERLVLVSTSCGGSFTGQEMKRLIKDLGPDFWKRRRAFVSKPEEAYNYVFSQQFMEKEATKYKIFAHRFFEMKPPQCTIARHFVCASRFTSQEFMKKIKVPTLVVHGNEDNLIDVEGAKILAKSIPSAQYLEIEKCGHFPMIEKADFYKEIVSFMGGKKIGKEL
tara:strand:- start:40124 stop:40948 length:825 start_codon:yes stop_codon:yes gene_type:complete